MRDNKEMNENDNGLAKIKNIMHEVSRQFRENCLYDVLKIYINDLEGVSKHKIVFMQSLAFGSQWEYETLPLSHLSTSLNLKHIIIHFRSPIKPTKILI